MPSLGHVFWLFGMSGAGKSTLATSLIDNLRSRGRLVLALDGDVVRAGLCRGLGFSDDGRVENLRRAAETARLGIDSGLWVVASFITPRESHRQLALAILGRENLSLIHVDAPFEVCRQRDPKGLYARAADGKVPKMTGLTSAFEAPARADLVLHTNLENVPASASRLLEFARAKLTVPPPSATPP